MVVDGLWCHSLDTPQVVEGSLFDELIVLDEKFSGFLRVPFMNGYFQFEISDACFDFGSDSSLEFTLGLFFLRNIGSKLI